MICCVPIILGVCLIHRYGKKSSYELEELAMHLIITYDVKPSISASKAMVYRKGMSETIAFF